jgi:CelD/BcsL family acetyltransferase involved in cellulose biosynthesis
MESPCASRERSEEPSRPAESPAAQNTAASQGLTLVVYGPHASPNGFDALAGEWDALLQRARSNVLFLTRVWQQTWWTHLGHGDLWIVAFRRADTDALVGIAPLYHFTHADGDHAGLSRLTLVGCLAVSDYLDLIIAKGWEERVYTALETWLQSADAPRWDVLDLCNLPEVSTTYNRFADMLRGDGFDVEVFREDVAPQFALPRHYATYLQDQVDKKQRHEIRRKQRRAEREANTSFFMVGPNHCLEAEVDDFIALQRASRDDKAEFMTPEMRRFFNAIARAMYDAGYLRLFFLTIDGEKAATLFAFEYDQRFLLYNSGYDPDAHAQLSPGWVLLAYSIQYAIAVGCHTFDFMQGDEEYKYRFGSHDYNVMRMLVRRGTGA